MQPKDIDCQVIKEGKEGLESIRNGEFDLIMLDKPRIFTNNLNVWSRVSINYRQVYAPSLSVVFFVVFNYLTSKQYRCL